MKLIEFGDGKWGIREASLPFMYQYLNASVDNNYFWCGEDYVDMFAKFGTKEEALKRYEYYCEYKNSKKIITKIKLK